MTECEIWKTVKGFEGFYEVSSLGRVKSLGNGNSNNSKERILKPVKCNGYLRVPLWKDGKPKNFSVHRLVANAFIPNPLNLPQVNHKDENKENNCVDNLEWCTQKYNVNYGSRTEKCSKKLINREDLSKIVHQFTKSGEFVREWNSLSDVQREIGYSIGNISQCCQGKRKSAYGYIWSFDNLNKYNEIKLF